MNVSSCASTHIVEKEYYTKGKKDGSQLISQEFSAQTQGARMALLSGTLFSVITVFVSYIVWSKRVSQKYEVILEQLQNYSRAKNKELCTTRAQKSVLQTAQIHQLLTVGKQKDTIQKMIRRNSAQSSILEHSRYTKEDFRESSVFKPDKKSSQRYGCNLQQTKESLSSSRQILKRFQWSAIWKMSVLSALAAFLSKVP